MRVAIVTESFPPDINGVAHSVVRVAEHLVARGHRPLVIAPEPASGTARVAPPVPYPVVRVPSVPMPGYPGFRLGLPSRRLPEAVLRHGTDVVHLASPFFLGARGSAVAQRLGLPHVAVYQTDIPAYAAAYRVRGLGEAAAWRWLRAIHNAAGRTLAPSTASATALRGAPAPDGETLVGYVGRSAAEKRPDLLAPIVELPGMRLVVNGGGPAKALGGVATPAVAVA